MLLELKKKTRDEPVRALTRECLSVLGYAEPPRGPGVRILSIDGGGVRGLLVIEVLRQLEKCTGKRISELFDYIVGVSTGEAFGAIFFSPGVHAIYLFSFFFVFLMDSNLEPRIYFGCRRNSRRHPDNASEGPRRLSEDVSRHEFNRLPAERLVGHGQTCLEPRLLRHDAVAADSSGTLRRPHNDPFESTAE